MDVHTTTSNIMGKGKSWAEDEQIRLCESYVKISGDVLVGNDQCSDMFWRRVVTTLACMKQFKKINKLCYSYHTFKLQCEKYVPSGENLEDAAKRAAVLFRTKHKESFNLFFEYAVLMDLQKYRVGVVGYPLPQVRPKGQIAAKLQHFAAKHKASVNKAWKEDWVAYKKKTIGLSWALTYSTVLMLTVRKGKSSWITFLRLMLMPQRKKMFQIVMEQHLPKMFWKHNPTTASWCQLM